MSKFGSPTHYLTDGTPVSDSEYQAVGQVVSSIGVCTGTLITDRLVLTAAHCLCDGQTAPTGCVSRASFTFINVFPVGNSTNRTNVRISGDVLIYPQFAEGGEWLRNDFALIRLDIPASRLVASVTPIAVERPDMIPQVGENLTLVGFGRTGDNCEGQSMGKRKIRVPISEISAVTIRLNDPNRYVCPGDSGGPAINSAGNVVGVASSANFNGNSNYDPTFVAYKWIFGTGRILRVVGRLAFLRVHDLATGFGHPTDPIEGEVVAQLDTTPDAYFGFTLRADLQSSDHLGTLDELRNAFVNKQTVGIEYEVTGPTNGRILRIIRGH